MSGVRLIRGAALVLAAVAALVAGCASDKPKPTPLETYTAQLAARPAWQARLDSVQFPLAVHVREGQFTVAGTDGTVLALDAASGRELWRGQAGGRLSAGVGSDGQRAAVVTVDNELVVLDRGAKRWSTRLASRTTTAPLVAGERVFVIGVDRVVHAFDAIDGRRLWTLQRPGEALTLAQPGLLAAWRNTLVAGLGALMTGIDPTTGSVRWEVPLTAPRGTNEVERLNDLVGPPLRLGDQFCARAFQTAVGCVAISGPDSASLRWVRRRRLRPAQRLEDRRRRAGLEQRAAAVPRPERAAVHRPRGGLRRCRGPVALPRPRRRPNAAAPADRRLACRRAAGAGRRHPAGRDAQRRSLRLSNRVSSRP